MANRGISSTLSEGDTTASQTHKRRHASVYDAVAGRIGVTGFIPKHKDHFAFDRDQSSTSRKSHTADVVYSMRKNVPIRYQENDWYEAPARNIDKSILPDSDLLKALHAYASDLYSRDPSGKSMYQAFNGRALLGFGILLEEMCRDSLGDSGDLALAEGAPIEAQDKTLSTDDEAQVTCMASVAGDFED